MKFFHLTTIITCFLTTYSFQAQTFTVFYNQIVQNASSDNILDDLNTFEDFGIKEAGTSAIEATKDWIIARYQSLGYSNIETQSFNVYGQSTSNIIITKTGSLYPDTFLIIEGHYDTANGPGVNDNGSGTVLILELARLLKNIDTEYSIKFIHFSGEEAGLIGSQYYVNNTVIPENLDIKLVLNIDQVGGLAGTNNNTIVCERDESSRPSYNNAASAIATQELANCFGLYSNLQTEISNAYGSDYVPFEDNGEIITGIYEKNESPYPHTPLDVLDNMDPDYLYQVTKGTIGAALHFAVARESMNINETNVPDKIIVSPNPSDGNLTIQLNQSFYSVDVQLTIYDSLGKTIYTTPLINQSTLLDLNFLSSGIYNFVFTSNKGNIVKRIII